VTRRSYTDADKADALALYESDGPTVVEAKLGIPKGTVTKWAKAAGTPTRFLENRSAGTQASALEWEQRRVDLAHRIGATAELALTRATEALEGNSPREAQQAATTMAILIDKAQLLTGGVTARTETTGASIDAEVAALAAELGMNAARASA
jgi:transposase-like protein